MRPKWLIEDFAPDNNFNRFAEEVKRQGYECVTIKYEPFQSGSFKQYGMEDCVIVQSSLQLASQLIKEKRWTPNAWLNLKAYECSTYYAHLGKYLFNDVYAMMPRSEVVRRKDWIYDVFGRDGCVFIRPSSGFKTFTGQLFTLERFTQDWQWVIDFTDPDCLVVISTPKNILAEWRFVVTHDGIITGSLYKKDGKREHREIGDDPDDRSAYVKANEIARGSFIPDTVYVIDICKGADGEFYLLEIGSFSCAGLYGCNMERIVTEVSAIAQKEWDDIYNI
jgi:hypothetical protein